MEQLLSKSVIFKYGGENLAAIITHVNADGSVNLCAFSKAGSPTPYPYIKKGRDNGMWSFPEVEVRKDFGKKLDLPRHLR